MARFVAVALCMAVAAGAANTAASAGDTAAPVSSECAAAASRRVNWYLAGGRIPQNVAFLANNSASATGVYLCCNSFSFAADGSFAGLSAAQVAAETTPLRALGLKLYYVVGIAEAAVHSGAWTHGIAAAVAAATLAPAAFDGFIVDYEPADNYTAAHAQAYADFLGALAGALHPVGKVLGFDVAGWGILDFWKIYATTGADIFTSMTPTYSGANLTNSQLFLAGEIAGGIPLAAIGVGIGTALAPGEKPEWNYNWTADKLSTFLAFVGETGLQQVDFWRADIDHYQDVAPYFLEQAAAFLHPPACQCAPAPAA